jgi:phospholipid-binding lipoprotein MlaA
MPQDDQYRHLFEIWPLYAMNAPGDPETFSTGTALPGQAVATPHTEVAIKMDFTRDDGKQGEGDEETEEVSAEQEIADPIEPLNRVFFTFNDKLYFWVMKPASNLYAFFVPEWGRVRVRNAFSNIKAPIRLVNALLQLKMHTFGVELSRFILNSTVGIGGLFDIASRHPELVVGEEDFGQTLGSYGIGNGFYLLWPILGPSSLRDSVGLAGDYFLNPVSYITPTGDYIAVRSGEEINDTSLRIGEYEDFKEAAIDPYISMRDAYTQYRRNKVRE